MAENIEVLVQDAIDLTEAVLSTQRELEDLAIQRRDAVRRLREEGMSLAQIAARLRLSRSGVQSILR